MIDNLYLKIFKILIKKILPGLLLTLVLYSCSYGAVIKAQVNFSPNNISTWFQNTGTFNQDIRTTNTPGFEWPKGSGKFALFTSGLCIGAYVNDDLRLGNASFNGEYAPGYVFDSSGHKLFRTDSRFRIYSVKAGDTRLNSIDYAEWKNMVPFGAPYNDINHNGYFDEFIDKPGVEDAEQTIFVCLTDADASNHTSSEGFSGGTKPLNAEVRLTAWGYDYPGLRDIQYVKWTVINKNDSAWNRAYFSIVTDNDLGDAHDDYVGHDTILQLGYTYNADNLDGDGYGNSYGWNPPAAGQSLIRSVILRNVNSIDTLKATSGIYFNNTGSAPVVCEMDPSSFYLQAYNYMRGLKRDGTPWLNPLTSPYTITKFLWTGNPETGEGWTEFSGAIRNCGGEVTGPVQVSNPRNSRFIISSGSDFLNINPGDTQKIVMSQMIARGSNNLNSVTKLKELASLSRRFYYLIEDDTEVTYVEPPYIPVNYSLKQNYPNPFNPITTIRYEMKKLWKVKIQVYDTRGELIKTLVNEEKPQGVYEIKFDASNIPSGVYFVKMVSGGGFEDSKKMVVIK